MTPQQIREFEKIVNGHASHINTLTAIVSGLISELRHVDGGAALERAKDHAIKEANAMNRPFQPKADTAKIAAMFRSVQSQPQAD